MSRRADKIIAEAEKVAHEHWVAEPDSIRIYGLQEQIGFLNGSVRGLAVQLDQYEGIGVKPAKGCDIDTVCYADMDWIVEYEYSPGSPSRVSGPPEDCYEGDPTYVCIVGILVNGAFIDPRDLFAEVVVETMETQLLERCIERDNERDV